MLLTVVAGSAVAADAPVLTVSTPFLTASLTVGDLEGLHRLVDTGNANGDQVAFIALRRDQACPSGFTGGRWMRMSERGGLFQGRWMSHDGRPAGHLRGIWGVRQNGERVFFGKVIDAEGRFVGRLRGTWGDGYFRGVYHSREGRSRGVVYGRYRGDDGRGFFRGRWAQACGEGDGECRCEEPSADASRDTRPPCACDTADGNGTSG